MSELVAITPDGARLQVTVAGTGPPLLMIPGLGATRRVFDPIRPALQSEHTTVVYNPRGIRGSTLGEAPARMEVLADDAMVVLAAAGFERADVWGASLGGMVAQHVALAHAGRVDRLLLAATSPGGPQSVVAAQENRDRLIGRGARTPGDAYRLACTVLYAADFQELHEDFIEEEIAERARHPIDGRAFRFQRAASEAHDTWDALPSLRVPTLVLHGTADAVQPLANAVALAERIPGAQRHWFEGRGHLFFHEVPHETVEVVQHFLDSTASRMASR